MEKLLRYKKINGLYYYDSVRNRIIKSEKKLTQMVKSHRVNIIPQFDREYIEMNLQTNRQQLILSVTENCNLRCKYCAYYDTRYIQKENKVVKMSFEIAKCAIDSYITHSEWAEKRCIAFYGGEPLLNLDLIKQCVDYVNSLNLNKEMMFLITTNAVLITEEVAEFLYRNRFNVNISLDGPQIIHDRYRIDAYGQDTFDRIMNAINYLLKIDFEFYKTHLYFLSVLAPPKSLKSILDFFSLMPFGNQYSRLIVTKHMEDVLRDMYDTGYVDEPDINTDCYPREMIVKMNNIERVRKILNQNPILNNNISPGAYCLPIVRRLFVAADGGYYICEKCDQIERNCYGSVYEGINYDKLCKKQEEVISFHENNCKRCWALRFCNVCYANMDKYPACCNEFCEDTLVALANLIEEDEKKLIM